MAIGDPQPQLVDFVNWHDLYNRTDDDDAIIEGIAYRGRWTALASPAKAGKSTILLALAVEATKTGYVVVYLDAEMGRNDVLDRVADWMRLKPNDLTKLHYSDLPPKLDNVQGATTLYHTVEHLNPDLVIIDGLNGVVNGAENEDTTWRDMYEWAIAPLKERNVAIVSADNLGKDRTLGPRGSSVKLDKADAVLRLERTETGIKLTATHRRTASYPTEQEYTVTDASEAGPAMKVIRVGSGSSAPAGTNTINALLDQLGAPADISRRTARRLLNENGHDAPGNDVFGAMLKWRRERTDPFVIHNPGPVLGPARTTRTTHLKVVLDGQDHSEETPASGVVPTGWSTSGPPPAEAPNQPGPPTVLEQPYEDPFA